MKICIIGTGYVGLVSGVCFSDIGNDVICVDNNQKKIQDLNNGIIFYSSEDYLKEPHIHQYFLNIFPFLYQICHYDIYYSTIHILLAQGLAAQIHRYLRVLYNDLMQDNKEIRDSS